MDLTDALRLRLSPRSLLRIYEVGGGLSFLICFPGLQRVSPQYPTSTTKERRRKDQNAPTTYPDWWNGQAKSVGYARVVGMEAFESIEMQTANCCSLSAKWGP